MTETTHGSAGGIADGTAAREGHAEVSEPEYAAAGVHDIEQLAAAVRRASSSDAPRVLIGIDGPGASGKSTLATLLATALGGAEVVHGDDFYRPSATRPDGDAEVGGQFDLERLLHQVVAPAAAGKEVTYQIYDWDRDELGPWVSVPEGSPLIVEGVYTTELRLRDHYTYRIFCLADRDVRLNRGLARDGESARSQWVDEWMPAEDRYVARQRPDLVADIVLIGNGADVDHPVFHRRRGRD
ncbi:uridine kinase [Streptomyces sp. NPDC059989]|uniref:uridine kinase family protein n=1 Tax=Streptomyces sp. NPDC059989 TaxID=3347026 RepID=UPI0036C4E684